jgi:uncharacterized membrane protein
MPGWSLAVPTAAKWLRGTILHRNMNQRGQRQVIEDPCPETVDEFTEKNVRAIARLEKEARANLSWTDRLATQISRFCGSMAFVWVHVVLFTGWILANTVFAAHPLDPFPFSLLTLVVSLEAIFLSTFIMISENRQEHLSERRSNLDLQINLLAEQESTKVLQLTEEIARKLGIDPTKFPEVSALEQTTHPERLIRQIDQNGHDQPTKPAQKSGQRLPRPSSQRRTKRKTEPTS